MWITSDITAEHMAILWKSAWSSIRPSDFILPNLWLRYLQCLPHCRRCIHNIVSTWGLIIIASITTMDGITLINHLGMDRSPIGMYIDVLEASASFSVPTSGECNYLLMIAVVLLSHSNGPPPSPPSAKLLRVMVAWVYCVTGGEQWYFGYILLVLQQSESFSSLMQLWGLPRK